MAEAAKKDQIDALFQNFLLAIQSINGKVEQQKADDEKPYIMYSVAVEKSRYSALMVIDPDVMTFTVLLQGNVTFSSANSREVAVILNLCNDMLPMGAFSTTRGNGMCYYELTTPFADCQFSQDALASLAAMPILAAVKYEPLFAKYQYDNVPVAEVITDMPSWETDDGVYEAEGKAMFSLIQNVLKEKQADYEADEYRLSLTFRAKHGRKQIPITMLVDAPRQLILVMSWLPFQVRPIRRVDMAVATLYAGSTLSEGKLVYQIFDGSIHYRTEGIYARSEIGSTYIDHLITSAVVAVEKYSQQLQLLNDGDISLKTFLSQK